MNFGIRAHDVGVFSPEGLVAELKKYTFDCCQLPLAKAIVWDDGKVDLSDESLLRVKKAFSDVKISVLGGYFNASSPDENVREVGIANFCDMLRAAKKLNVLLVGTETGSYSADWSYHPWNDTDEAIKTFFATLPRLLEAAEQIGVDVGIEPVATHVLNSLSRIRDMLREFKSERLKIIFDPVNLLPSAREAEKQERFFDECFDLFGDKIAAVHLKDFVIADGKIVRVSQGTGRFNYTQLFENVKNCDMILEEVDKRCLPQILRDFKEYREKY